MQTATELKQKGMQTAIDHADRVNLNWSGSAYQFLINFAQNNRNTFMTEDVRKAAKGVIDEPPSQRAWGGIITRASKKGLIKHLGYSNVKNPKAHCTPASIWVSNTVNI